MGDYLLCVVVVWHWAQTIFSPSPALVNVTANIWLRAVFLLFGFIPAKTKHYCIIPCVLVMRVNFKTGIRYDKIKQNQTTVSLINNIGPQLQEPISFLLVVIYFFLTRVVQLKQMCYSKLTKSWLVLLTEDGTFILKFFLSRVVCLFLLPFEVKFITLE